MYALGPEERCLYAGLRLEMRNANDEQGLPITMRSWPAPDAYHKALRLIFRCLPEPERLERIRRMQTGILERQDLADALQDPLSQTSMNCFMGRATLFTGTLKIWVGEKEYFFSGRGEVADRRAAVLQRCGFGGSHPSDAYPQLACRFAIQPGHGFFTTTAGSGLRTLPPGAAAWAVQFYNPLEDAYEALPFAAKGIQGSEAVFGTFVEIMSSLCPEPLAGKDLAAWWGLAVEDGDDDAERPAFLRPVRMTIAQGKGGKNWRYGGGLPRSLGNVSFSRDDVLKLFPVGTDNADRKVWVSWGVFGAQAWDEVQLCWRRTEVNPWLPFGEAHFQNKVWNQFLALRRKDSAKGKKPGDEHLLDVGSMALVQEQSRSGQTKRKRATVDRRGWGSIEVLQAVTP